MLIYMSMTCRYRCRFKPNVYSIQRELVKKTNPKYNKGKFEFPIFEILLKITILTYNSSTFVFSFCVNSNRYFSYKHVFN